MRTVFLRSVFALFGMFLLLDMLAPPPAPAFAGNALPQTVTVSSDIAGEEQRELPLRGSATFTYYGFRVYDAAFYIPSNVDALANESKVLELLYRVSISRDELCASTRRVLESNPTYSQQSIEMTTAAVCEIFRDVSSGDRYTLEHSPGRGASLFLNGKLQGEIPEMKSGVEIAKMFYGIWLSDYSVGKRFTERLLGRGD